MGVPLQILLHLLTACATLAIGLSLNMFSPASRVVEIDSEAVLRAFVSDLGDIKEDAQVERLSGQFLTTMQSVLERYAAQNGVIVVEAKLAIAGATDITDEAYRQAMFMMPSTVARVQP